MATLSAMIPLVKSPAGLHLQSNFYGASMPQKHLVSQATCPIRDGPLKAARCSLESGESASQRTAAFVRSAVCGACVALAVASAPFPSLAADRARLPPLSTDPLRCERAFDGNTIGQANGVADKVLDLRFCNFSDDKINLKGKTLSAALMANANFDGADLTEAVLSKAYAVGASFKGTLFNNAVVDRVNFANADMRGVQFVNTVLSGSTFEGANLEGSNFEDALIGYVDIQKICRNETLPEEARIELACKRN
eukprot:TRINITY_DN32523_c0_g1_i1.p1 TRINITY_DN32523_c0_g1~~TRINITY_DN32523_c0_g1_i1.p1  ORF type:complete len:252 (+),score=50.27 TRINITY_DN32523_c0_g1_i1:118-873(+)